MSTDVLSKNANVLAGQYISYGQYILCAQFISYDQSILHGQCFSDGQYILYSKYILYGQLRSYVMVTELKFVATAMTSGHVKSLLAV